MKRSTSVTYFYAVSHNRALEESVIAVERMGSVAAPQNQRGYPFNKTR